MMTKMKKKSAKGENEGADGIQMKKRDDGGGAGGKRKITKRETVTRIVQGVEEDGGKKREEEEYEGIDASESYRRPKCWNCESYLIWVESLEQLLSYDSEYDEGYGCDICDDFPNGSFPMWHCGNGCAFDGCVKCFGSKKEREEVVYDKQDPVYSVVTGDGWICSLPLSSANAKLFDDWFLRFLDQELNWDESEMLGKIISSFFK